MPEKELLEQFNVSLCEFDSSQWSRDGFLDPVNRVVYINRDLSTERRLKVILHELGHLELAPEPYQRNVLTCAERQLEEQKQAKKRLAEVHEVSVQYFAYNYYDQPVSAGTGQYLNEVQIETIQLPVKVDADFVCPIYGDSMEPDYKSGDYVFVKLTVELPSGTVGVFDYEGEAYIKQLIIEKDKAYLRSFNKKYKDIPINSDSDFRIIGKVVDVYRGK